MGGSPSVDDVHALIDAGAALHWLVPFEKRPIEDKWSEKPRYSAEQLRQQHRKDANIGIRLGQPSCIDGLYLHLIDLDIRKTDAADEARAALLKLWPEALSFPTVQSGSMGESRHFYFLTSKPFGKAKLAQSDRFEMVFDQRLNREVKKRDWEIDLMGTGSQAAIPPSIHPETRKPYLWLTPLDLDLPMMMEVSAATVAGWGVREAVKINFDDDDLDAILQQSPLDLDDDEIRKTLFGLPPEWVEDRDQWWTAGMALHHQYQGANQGFELWCEWARQSEKFNAKDSAAVWKSFKGDKRPIRMATLIQAEQTHRLKSELDFDLDDAFHPPALSGDLSDLLGDTPTVPVELKVETEVMPESPLDDWQQLLHRNEDGELKATLPNVRLMVNNDMRTFGVVAYNEFMQDIVFRKAPSKVRKKRDRGRDPLNLTGQLWEASDPVNGTLWTDSHDTSLRSIFEAPTTQGGYGVKISDRDLRGAVDMAARDRSFHPVREVLNKMVWDGKPRMDRLFIDYLGAEDNAYNRETARLILLGAVTRVFEPGHKFDFVVILEGAQGKGKSTFIRTLALHWFAELTGDVSDNKEMVELMQGKWILEMGEMSSMARAEVNDMKAFVTRTVDKVRLSYGKRATEFPRQCVFFGSTNDDEYLRDVSGGRRWWPVRCHLEGMIDNPKLAREVFQIWAEVVHLYREMRAKTPYGDLPLFMTNHQAAEQAMIIQESRRVETAEETLAGQIQAWLDTPIGDDFDDLDGTAPVLRQETCIAQIWVEMFGRDGSIPHTESTKIGKAIRLLPWERSSGPVMTSPLNKKYGKCRVYTRR